MFNQMMEQIAEQVVFNTLTAQVQIHTNPVSNNQTKQDNDGE